MSYQELRQNVSRISDEIFSLVSKAKSLPFVKEGAFKDWERICAEIKAQISGDMFHVAVVGAIKSGKSTLVNCLFQGDYLKRGAGIITSFITKVRKGKSLRATLKLKSQKEINTEIEKAISNIFLYESRFKEVLPFDIRDGQKVQNVFNMVKGLDLDLLLKNGTQDVHYLTLSHYLKGYTHLRSIISDKERIMVYEGKDFEEHKKFVSDDNLSIYLKDIVVEIDGGIIDESIEIADCQGSDSPNPLHILMVQEYLLSSQLIIYVISSRIGIREADIRFLHTIKRMGMMDEVIFVINFDFDEHKSIQDLLAIVDETRDQLSLFRPEPCIFTFSALFNLLNEMEGRGGGAGLTDKERSRLYQWRNEKDFVKLSNTETAKFLDYLKEILSDQRYSIFIKSWLERLYLISSDIRDWLSFNINMISGDKASYKELIQRLRDQKLRLKKTRFLLKDTIEGSSQKLKERMKRDIDQFFDKKGKILNSLRQFTAQFQIAYHGYMDILQKANISHALYIIFREYKRSMDIFIVRSINPLIMKFLKELDKKIENGFISIIEPYQEMLGGIISEFRSNSNELSNIYFTKIINLELVKREYNIRPPSIIAALEYSPLLTPEIIVRFGLYKFLNFVKKAIKKGDSDSIGERVRALEHGLNKIKRQTLDSLMFNIANYKENLKYQYAFSLIDSCKEYVINSVNTQLKYSFDTFLTMEEELEKHQFDREFLIKELTDMKDELDQVLSHIEKLGNSGSFIHLLK